MQKQVKILREEMEEKQLSERMEAMFPSGPSKPEHRTESGWQGQSNASPLELLKKYRDQLDATLQSQQRQGTDLIDLNDALKRHM